MSSNPEREGSRQSAADSKQSEPPREYSSPACLMHELESEFLAADIGGPLPDASDWESVKAWRKRAREALLQRREALGARERRERGERAKERLLQSADLKAYPVIGIYWPFRGEIDVRDIARAHIEAGGEAALPVVVQKGAPLEFWRWYPDRKMDRGVWNLPIPKEREVVQPDALIVPLVGFDRAGYRLGYGGGYYDRTLAAMARRPVCIGLGYSACEIPSILPQPHDIPMTMIVTEGICRPAQAQAPRP